MKILSDKYYKTAAIVLAAGKGTRIGQRLPKVIYPIVGKPMLYYCLDLIKKIPISEVYVVVGYKATDVVASIRNEDVKYVYQKDQLGTGHAANVALSKISKSVDEIIIFNGDDSAFFEVSTIRSYLASHHKSKAKISFMSGIVNSANGLGRISRDSKGNVLKIIEEKDASETEKKIKEVNVGCYIFERKWLEKTIKRLEKSASGEYYITDLVSLALGSGDKINNYLLEDNNEWRGINSQEELKNANDQMLARLTKRKEPTVFIFDIDNTLINTDSVKEYVSSKLIKKVIGPEKLSGFWQEYENSRKRLGYVSIPEFSDSYAELVSNPDFSEKIRKMFYTIPFNKFVFDGVDELMEYVDPRGEIVILTEGDLVYQPMKIKNLGISKYLDELYVFENEGKNIPEIGQIYKGRRIIAVDDKITVLENIKRTIENSITIHFKHGLYKDINPTKPDFKADFVATSTYDISSFIRSLY